MYLIALGWRPMGSNRVIRGGSWNNNARNCRSANRNNNTPDNRNNNLGFRPVLAPAQPGRWIAPRLTRLPSSPAVKLKAQAKSR
ncbi:MAG: SUMF1/EgtB/PvdO family nonheme iron enzyme [Verrucomicrobia bacterium]|nr:SUMF1/EgtB/PvdO family nonheme iron enzyme [Verrucomicrobiota bacterium]